MLCVAGADSPWILARHVRDRKIPFSAGDGYGTMTRGHFSRTDSRTERRTNSSTSSSGSNRHDSFTPSERSRSLFLPTTEARHLVPSVGDVWVLHAWLSSIVRFILATSAKEVMYYHGVYPFVWLSAELHESYRWIWLEFSGKVRPGQS